MCVLGSVVSGGDNNVQWKCIWQIPRFWQIPRALRLFFIWFLAIKAFIVNYMHWIDKLCDYLWGPLFLLLKLPRVMSDSILLFPVDLFWWPFLITSITSIDLPLPCLIYPLFLVEVWLWIQRPWFTEEHERFGFFWVLFPTLAIYWALLQCPGDYSTSPVDA